MLFMNYSILWVTEFSFCCKYTAALLQNSWSAPCVYVHIFTISLSPMHTCKLMHYAVAYVLRDLHVTVLWAHWALDWILINLMTILTPRFLWSWALLSQTRLSQDKSQSKRPEFTHNSILAKRAARFAFAEQCSETSYWRLSFFGWLCVFWVLLC